MPASTPRIAVDRIEGSRAILDIGGEQIEIPAALLPEGAGEGTLLSFSIQESEEIRDEATERLERLRARSASLDDIEF